MLASPSVPVGGPLPPQGLPALASLGLASQMRSAARPAVVMGATTRFAWCALGDEVVLLASPDAVRFPNAIHAGGGWEGLEPGEEISIGSGVVLGRGLDWRIVRWWDSRVTPIHTERHDVIARVSSFAENVPLGSPDLEAALADGDRAAILDAAREMLGSGAGLTPQGDDRLLGAFAAYRHVTASIGHPEGRELIDDLADELLSIASARTTLLSVTLLRHALAGEVPDPVADVLRAVTGHGTTSAALDRCLVLGDTSGRALVFGMACGARAGCQVAS